MVHNGTKCWSKYEGQKRRSFPPPLPNTHCMSPPTYKEMKNELFPHAVEQFMSLFTKDDTSILYALSGPTSYNVWELAIPKRICLGEVTHGRTGYLFREQSLPSDLQDRFNSYFGKYILKNIRGETVAIVQLFSLQHTYQQVLAEISIEYGPPSCQQCPFPTGLNEALVRQNQTLEEELKLVQQELENTNTMLAQWNAMWDNFHRRNRVRHGHVSRILVDWYAERQAREECCTCWNPMVPTDIVIPQCGHFICATCHGKCTKCPLCRESFTVPAAPFTATS